MTERREAVDTVLVDKPPKRMSTKALSKAGDNEADDI